MHILSCGENDRTLHRDPLCVWPKPGKEPPQDIDRAVFVTIPDEPTILATIGPLPERHGLEMPTATALFGCVALI